MYYAQTGWISFMDLLQMAGTTSSFFFRSNPHIFRLIQRSLAGVFIKVKIIKQIMPKRLIKLLELKFFLSSFLF